MDTPLQKAGTELPRARTRGRRRAAARRVVLFLALGSVVLSFGLIAGKGDAADHTRSFSQIASAQARSEARALAAEAQALAGGAPDGTAAEFQLHAEGLRTQAALLAGTGREPAAAPTRHSYVETLATSRPEAGPGGKPGPDAERQQRNTERYLEALWESAEANLHAAWRADAGTARLLAATGSAQQIWALRLADLSGVELPAGPDAAGTDAAGTGGSANCPGGKTGDRPETAAATAAPGDRPDAAAALKTVIDAELGTAYAYEVALAQAEPSPEVAGAWRKQVTDHKATGTDAVAHLSNLCLPAVAPVAAYRLDPDFLRDPAASLPAMEEQFPAVYADLVALSDGNLRGWAIDRLTAVSTERYRTADTVPAAPGLDAVPDDLPWN
ncbi:ferritin-like domain-containing protein [Arthrobacter sp. zg-Y40]|uniref:DUF4439 domain-containing protein n=1 Tax=Arthrobacter sp. zg-Y40 TaxID=2886939 RepID=UPI001D152FA5|nr:ferritin-like domain-containing protein [Arthrobacter sp. zg-Y40]